jgi:hypothetical protein
MRRTGRGGSTGERTGVGNGKDRRKGGGVDGVKNRSGKWEGPAGGGLYGVYNSPVHYARGPH